VCVCVCGCVCVCVCVCGCLCVCVCLWVGVGVCRLLLGSSASVASPYLCRGAALVITACKGVCKEAQPIVDAVVHGVQASPGRVGLEGGRAAR
jgi:hypothetical protein